MKEDDVMKQQTIKHLKEQYKNREVIGGIYRITCTKENVSWLRSTKDITGAKNLFNFSVSTNSCVELCMTTLWNTHGSSSFVFEVVEELKKGESQSDKEFRDDLKTLLDIYNGNKKQDKPCE